MAKISAYPADTAPDVADVIPFVDVSASATEKVTVDNLAASAAFSGRYAPLPAPAGASTTAFDDSISAYNWKRSNTAGLAAALSKSQTGSYVSLAFVGDSITAGRVPGTTTPSTDAFCQRMMAYLSACGYTLAGDGVIVPCNYRPFDSANVDQRWSFTGTWTESGNGHGLQASVASTATLTSTRAGTIVEVFYFNGSTAPFYVSIDGGADVTVTPTGTSTLATYQVTGLSNATHTVRVSRIAGNCQFWGATVRSASGLTVSNFGESGVTSSRFTNTDWYQNRAQIAHTAPSAVFLMAGTNDAISAVSVATYKANMDAIIDYFGTLNTSTGDVVIMSPYFGGTEDFAPYRAALYELADENDVPLIDWGHAFVSEADATSNGIRADDYHPNKAGFDVMGANLARILA